MKRAILTLAALAMMATAAHAGDECVIITGKDKRCDECLMSDNRPDGTEFCVKMSTGMSQKQIDAWYYEDAEQGRAARAAGWRNGGHQRPNVIRVYWSRRRLPDRRGRNSGRGWNAATRRGQWRARIVRAGLIEERHSQPPGLRLVHDPRRTQRLKIFRFTAGFGRVWPVFIA
jgi:hypothetical protein